MQNLDSALTGAATVILGAVTLCLALRYASGRKLHPSEPTVVPPWIPFIGHLLGMALHGGRYIKRLGLSRPKEPIFTLPVPGSRIYVVTDPSLAAAIQRNSKVLSFTPLIPDITKRVLGLDDGTVEVVRQNLDPEPGDPRGFLADMHDVVYASLGPGHYLNSLSCEASQELCLQLCELKDNLQSGPLPGGKTDLLSLVRHIVSTGTARYLFGEVNPISGDPELEQAFWDFDEGVGELLIGIFPSITASQAYRGREKIVAAFINYLESNHDVGAAQIVRDRIRVEREWEMSPETIARSALSFLFAGIVNTTTTTFWVVLRLFADPQLLASVREELRAALAASEEKIGHDTLSITIVRDRCPTLSAVFRESLRIGSENFSVRLIKEDTMLAEKYFLKKGAIVQISGGVIHSDKSIWGDDVDEFNPSRFLGAKTRSGGFHPAAFRGFGGGKTLCPGRHFAINEILLLAAMIVLAFDMGSPDGGPVLTNVAGFSWNAHKALHPHRPPCDGRADEANAIPLPSNRLHSDNLYTTALKELGSLETQPLCHRIAARLLVNNCHLLHGQDETAELADTGRLTRDFIDSYAASLAICDLERGSFAIPRECSKFREPALSKVEVAKTPHLHVSTVEIDKCLEGLAQSDSSWTTWISYRHKAVRFCEIAKSDNEKDSTIHLYKKVTEIIKRFSEKVEVQVEEQLRRVDHLMRKTTEATDSLLPRTESLKSQLKGLDRLINEKLMAVSKQSALEVQSGLQDATQLHDVVNILLESIRKNQVQIVMEHNNALQTVRRDTFDGVETMMATIATAASSSVRLQSQLEETELRADRVMEKQNKLEKSLDRLQKFSHDMFLSHGSHQDKLDSAQRSVMGILGALQGVESSTNRIHSNFLSGTGWSWWPHILCPAASLFLGSYRLAPSIARNLLLLGLGEVAGLTISAAQVIRVDTSMPSIHNALPNILKTTFNDTAQMFHEAHDL
ncbi:uncharacterized protein LMH87_009207 [Akanthomyces muscarius]|uniref:Cytochrome P450 n=1 Tax=Akanthomyces muscarius TaxID=2231603 RepID=A0A9W8UQF5_AKAMU|nr:uncharacterized protein LMH87_009207 [Akanthomyces muscarius]KAJ4158691.1 hypothetical protein LMH87_009207 [Akanthomyces muscarius]